MNTTPELSCDVLIIGSGAAGLSLALRLAEKHQVIVLSKGPVSEGSTFYAQGGIAAVFDETDSIDSHVEDTLIAGAGLTVLNRYRWDNGLEWKINMKYDHALGSYLYQFPAPGTPVT